MPPTGFRPHKQVLIRPVWDMGLKGRLFETIYPWSMTQWRESAAKLGFRLDGWDAMPLEKADCVWLLDLPERKREFDDARRRARPGTPFVLHVLESPVGRQHNFHPANQAQCDYVVTYQPPVAPSTNRFHYRLPHSLAFNGMHRPFAERRGALMVNTNRVEGYFAPRRLGLTGLPGIGQAFGGWKRRASAWLAPAKGELYSWRRAFAITAGEIAPDFLTIVGRNWNGERISWCSLLPRKPYRCLQAPHVPDKLELATQFRFCVAVENYRGTLGYISEKIFDGLLAGAVPVYLGDENITDVVPAAAFVDVRHFLNHRELLRFLQGCGAAEWLRMYEAGQRFLQTEAAREFSTDRFVATLNSILMKILGPQPAVVR